MRAASWRACDDVFELPCWPVSPSTDAGKDERAAQATEVTRAHHKPLHASQVLGDERDGGLHALARHQRRLHLRQAYLVAAHVCLRAGMP